MRIGEFSISNLGSYEFLRLGLSSQGLCLITGPTGSGKSTLCDVIPWIVWGKTSKNGTVDEIVRWGSKDTSGTIQVDGLCITRQRGAGNDLFISDSTTNEIRGKDLADTQKLINQKLGNINQYLASSYYHEFSETAQFFTATAKSRRELIEGLVDLNMAIDLSSGAKSYKKELSTEVDLIKTNLKTTSAMRSMRQEDLQKAEEDSKSWEQSKKEALKRLKSLEKSFEDDKKDKLLQMQDNYLKDDKFDWQELVSLEQKLLEDSYFTDSISELQEMVAKVDKIICTECGAPKDLGKKMSFIRNINKLELQRQENNNRKVQISRLGQAIEKSMKTYNIERINEEQRNNTYADEYESKKAEINPIRDNIKHLNGAILQLKYDEKKFSEDLEDFLVEQADIDLLLSAVEIFRQTLSTNMIKGLEEKTNQLLSDYFEAELRVEFTLETSDKLGVTIHKDGNVASFTQLSKGQRCLLKLCFGVAVMQLTAQYNAIQPDVVFFDEALDGMDSDLKVKSVRMFEYLATQYSSVFLVEHSSELKSLITNQIRVSLTEEGSIVEKV